MHKHHYMPCITQRHACTHTRTSTHIYIHTCMHTLHASRVPRMYHTCIYMHALEQLHLNNATYMYTHARIPRIHAHTHASINTFQTYIHYKPSLHTYLHKNTQAHIPYTFTHARIKYITPVALHARTYTYCIISHHFVPPDIAGHHTHTYMHCRQGMHTCMHVYAHYT